MHTNMKGVFWINQYTDRHNMNTDKYEKKSSKFINNQEFRRLSMMTPSRKYQALTLLWTIRRNYLFTLVF